MTTTQKIPGEREFDKPVPQISFLDTLADELPGGAANVFGAPVENDGVKVIPVAKARWGMGGGAQRSASTDRPESGLAGGGGAIAKPIGFIELAGGRSTFHTIRDPALVAWTAIAAGFFGLSAMRILASRTSSPWARGFGRRARRRGLRRLFG